MSIDMSIFVNKCPYCGRYAEAKTGFCVQNKTDCAARELVTNHAADRH